MLERISVEITTSCNLLCKTCFLTGLKQKDLISKEQYLNKFFNPNLFKKLIDEISENRNSRFFKKQDAFSFSLTGGEPFLHPQIIEFLTYAKERGVKIVVYTNGTLLDDSLAEKICKAEPDGLMFSIDGPEMIHDQIRGKGNFKKTRSAIKLIQTQKYHINAKSPKIYINAVINNLNIDYLSDIYSLAKSLNVNALTFSHLQWSDHALSSLVGNEFSDRLVGLIDNGSAFKMVEALEFSDDSKLLIPDSRMDILVEQIKLIKESYKKDLKQNVSIPYVKFKPDLSTSGMINWYGKRYNQINNCEWVDKWVRISVKGDVLSACTAWSYSFGNLKEKSLKKILKGKERKKFFEEIKNRGLF